MIKVEGKHNTALIYAKNLDHSAEGLIRALCASPISAGSTIRIMPDVHAGKGCAVGMTMTIQNSVAPGLVGRDIGCGMTVLKVCTKRLEMQKLDKLIHKKIPSGAAIRSNPHRFAEQAQLSHLKCARHVQTEKILSSVGTLGGGNHFIELDQGTDDTYWLIIHSGSRRLGAEVAGHYQKAAYEQTPEGIPYEFAYASGELMEHYLHDLKITQEFAELNRRAIADEIVRGMKFDVEDTFSTIHNYIDTTRMILRKGAVSAQKGEPLIIPMNMRDGCLLCIGKGNPDWNFSAPHGAGRLMSRADTLQSFTLSQYKKEMKGIFSTCVGRNTLDESPMAYKPMESILEQISPTVEITEHIRPIYNFKSGDLRGKT